MLTPYDGISPTGLFTPVASTLANCSALTFDPCLWSRNANGVITLSGSGALTVTTTLTNTSFLFSLPSIANNFLSSSQGNGTASIVRVAAVLAQGAGYVAAVGGGQNMQMAFPNCPVASAATAVFFFFCQYQSIQS